MFSTVPMAQRASFGRARQSDDFHPGRAALGFLDLLTAWRAIMRDWRIAVAAAVGTAALIGTAQAITDTVFTYSPARTGWYTINPADLVADNQAATYTVGTASLAESGTGSFCYLGGVHLPHGAKIGQVAIWYISDVGGADIQFQLVRTNLATATADFLAVKNAHDDSFTRKSAVAAVPAALATVHNGNYRYTFVVCPGSHDNIFYGARIMYTYTSAGD
jgi:hypothetical protein